MKTLVVEDDFTSRLLMQEILKKYGPVHIAVNGREAVEAVQMALSQNDPYDFICLDIMMPELDGQEALKQIRELENHFNIPSRKWTKIVMTTALNDYSNVKVAYCNMCDGYLVKPIDFNKLLELLRQFSFIE